MNEETPIRGRVRTIFRVLSVLTIVEGGLGFLLTAANIILVPFHYKTLGNLLGHPYSHSTSLLYLIGLTNLTVEAMLLVAGTLLWKLQRKGLVLLIWALVAEIIYFAIFATAVLTTGADRASPAASNAQGYIVGMGLVPFSVQIATAFPIVAGILIFFAYRYLGIPARPLE